ncbi:MAG: DNA polymerase/3'-5' exonuclease PolX [Halolamina sp.]
MSRNDEVAALLEEFADLLEAKGVAYKPSSYRRAAENVREYQTPVEELAAEGEAAVADIDRVGDAIAGKIVEFVDTGSVEELEELRAELPVDIEALTRVEGVGPKTVGTLYEELDVRDLDDLERAADEGAIREVKGFGPKTEQNIRENVEFARQAGERELLGVGRPLGETVREFVLGLAETTAAEIAGSGRRWKPTVGDVDVLAGAGDGDAVTDAFREWDRVEDVIEEGPTKASARIGGVRVDLRVVDPAEYGAALQYFTGSREHNVQLRNRAIDRGLKMNEYGVFDVADVDDPESDQRVGERVAGETEAEMYEALDLPPIPPELREGRGEVDAADAGELPELVAVDELRGDLHTHTEWSDGGNSIAEMAAAAAERGHDYHVVADHADGPGVFGDIGLSEAELREQAAAVADADEAADVELLHGVEANVATDGTIPTSDDLLAELDLVVASPHAALGQDRETATERLVAAVEHPQVDVLGHPTGRRINDRAGIDPDVEAVAEAAAEHGTALEVNANPHRLDLHGEAVRVAVEAGAPIAIDTDAHAPAGLDNLRYGVHTARRGWAETADVVNARDRDGLRAFLAG